MKISCNSCVGTSNLNRANAQKKQSFQGGVRYEGFKPLVLEGGYRLFSPPEPTLKRLKEVMGKIKCCLHEICRKTPVDDEIVLKAIRTGEKKPIILELKYKPGEESKKNGLEEMSTDWTTLGNPEHLAEFATNILKKIENANILKKIGL